MRKQIFGKGLDEDSIVVPDKMEMRVLSQDDISSSNGLVMQWRYMPVTRRGNLALLQFLLSNLYI